MPMIHVTIPSTEREVDEVGKSKKLFRVEVLFNERKHFVLRRSSEFHTLHRKLRKIIQTPDFPSKRNPHLRTKPLEQRRQELEDYIQEIIYQYEDVPQELLDFLHVKHYHTGNKISSMDFQLPHQRVMGFFRDPYVSDCTSGYSISSARKCAMTTSTSMHLSSSAISRSPSVLQVYLTSSSGESFRASTDGTSASASQLPTSLITQKFANDWNETRKKKKKSHQNALK
ncbi:sorting nexin-22 isoform X2 [Festucalex cinctus]